ncbi:MAG: formate dehydrogenase subunit beta [Myxococcales bacterium]|nr:formate dehydrogenase subunit beta [Myxococcota bacterium]MDW8283326.1 formate dehydrogenase subunit beta [Myxococcales bacterium]
MSDPLSILRTSATGTRTAVRSEEQVCMLIDTSTCIGCKACEVACVEWNDLHVEPEGGQRVLHSYQTMPDMTPAFWNLIRFNEVPVDQNRRPTTEAAGVSLMMLMRKDMCLHCAEPGCLIACPAEGAIVQWSNGIVDFQQEHCIGCGYCMTGCPFHVPKLDARTGRVYKCTMCIDRVSHGLGPACVKACPTGCLEFGTKSEMLARAERRVERLREEGFAQAGIYDPQGVGGTGVIYVLHHADQPELYGGLPRAPSITAAVRLWKGPLKWLGSGSLWGALGVAILHYLTVGPRRVAGRPGERQVLRYRTSERLLHWTIALSFLYLLTTGLGLWSPHLAFLLRVIGGGQVARAWHPVIGLMFACCVLLQLLRWRGDLRLSGSDWIWLRRLRDHVAGRHENLPPSGRFNAGQKLLFLIQCVLAAVLLSTGVPIWFPQAFAQSVRQVALLIHAAAGVLAMLSLLVHVYMAVLVTRGALGAMIEGTVSEAWAREHHAAWAEELLGPPSPP